MFISSEKYHERVLAAIAVSESVSIAVAFWGDGSENLLRQFKGRIRIVCNLLSGGTNPAPIEWLYKQKNVEVKHSSKLHAKVLIGGDRAIVGSANFSTNGLHYEGKEIEGWDEAGVEVHDSATIETIRGWYEELWSVAEAVQPADIELARYRWKPGRYERSVLAGIGGILDAPVDALKDRSIYLALYQTDTSLEAKTEFNQIATQQATPEIGAALAIQSLSFFESWSKFPMEGLIIDVLIGQRYSVSVDGVYERFPSLDREFRYKDGSIGSLHIVVRQTRVLGHVWDNKARNKLRNLLRPKIKNIMASVIDSDDPAICISLYEALTG